LGHLDEDLVFKVAFRQAVMGARLRTAKIVQGLARVKRNGR
jgi:hypothetical protein